MLQPWQALFYLEILINFGTVWTYLLIFIFGTVHMCSTECLVYLYSGDAD